MFSSNLRAALSCNSVAAILLIASGSGLEAQVPPQFRYLPRHGMQRVADPTFKIAVGDVNGDGAMDVVCANMGSALPGFQDRLFLNDGVGNLTDVTATNLPAALDWTGAVILGDIDFDGDLDLFFGNSGSQGSKLLLNDGKGVFTDVSATQLPPTPRTVYAAAFVDVDFDRDLDIVARDFLFLNDGRGFFTDATSNLPGGFYPWGMAVGDVDGDRDVDLVFGNYTGTPRLWLNDGKGVFSDGSGNLPPIAMDCRGTFGLGDVDGDGDLDLYFPNNNAQNQLWLNDGKGVFTDVTATNLPVDTYGEYAAILADIDGDGDLDALTANSNGGSTPFQNRLYLNDGKGFFTDATATRMDALPTVSVALVAADMDQDGDLDIVYGNWNQPSEIWFNHHRHIYAEKPPTLATNYAIDVYGMPGYAATVQVAIPFLGFRSLVPRIQIPGLGYLGINPSPVFMLPPSTIPIPGGKSTVQLPIPPNDPSLHGLPLFLQSLVFQVPNYYFTNVFPDHVQ